MICNLYGIYRMTPMVCDLVIDKKSAPFSAQAAAILGRRRLQDYCCATLEWRAMSCSERC